MTIRNEEQYLWLGEELKGTESDTRDLLYKLIIKDNLEEVETIIRATAPKYGKIQNLNNPFSE